MRLDKIGNIVIFGASGSLGQSLTRFLNSKYRLFCPNREELNFSSSDAIFDFLKNSKAEIVINSIALTDVNFCENNPQEAFFVNSEITKNIAIATAKQNAKMIQISTNYVFSGDKSGAYLESDRPSAINIYGESKLQAENFVEQICEDYAILRISWLLGDKNPHKVNFIDFILNQAKAHKKFAILDDQKGKLTIADDLALRIEEFFADEVRGIFHICNEGEHTRYDLVLETVKLLNLKDVEISIQNPHNLPDRSAKRPLQSSLTSEKIKLMPDWRESLKTYLEKNYGSDISKI
jgi:dTDP-4-dehydrorhamnose reductase